MDIDLDKLDLKELKQLKNKVDAAILSYEERNLQKIREMVQEQLKGTGIKLEDLVDKSPKSKRTVAPKYSHPENPDLTWTGRGRKPKWVIEHLDRGLDLDNLLIKK